MTGYAENAALANGFRAAVMGLVTKPFSMQELASKISAMLPAA